MVTQQGQAVAARAIEDADRREGPIAFAHLRHMTKHGTVATVDGSVTIVRVGASVGLGQPGDPDQVAVSARLFAETTRGARLSVARDTIVGGMIRYGELPASWKRGAGPRLPEEPELRRRWLESHHLGRRDVEDVINSLLGRDPEQIRPFCLSWGPLIELLNHNGVAVTEDELIATPFVYEFSEELLAELTPNANDGR